MPTVPMVFDRRGLVVVTAPSSEPVTTAECKTFLRVDTSDDDTLIAALNTSARQWVERIGLNRTIINTTYRLALDEFPCDSEAIELPLPPLSSVTSITYVDTAGATQTWGSSNYRVAADCEPGFIEPAYGVSYPSTRDVSQAVLITYVAGYGSSASAVPEAIKTAIKLVVEKHYDRWVESGGANAAIDSGRIPNYVHDVLAPYAIKGFA